MNLFDLIHAQPEFSLVSFIMLVMLLRSFFRRLFRCLAIRKHGWPPPYCDADGDLIKPDTDNEET